MKPQMTFMANGRCILVLALTAVMGGLPPMAALGASPEFARTEQEWARLQDNVIEYDEIPDLIHEYNATVQNNQYDYQKFREDYGDTNSDVADAYNDLAQDFYDDMSGETDAGSMMSDLQLDIQARNMLKQADNTLEDSKIYLLTYEMAEDNLAATAQSNMISYHKKQLELEQKQTDLELAREKYSLEQVKQAAGTVTAVDVLTAKESLQSSENNIKELESGIENLKEELYISLGWKHNDSPDIKELPQMDVSRMTLRRALALLQEDNLVINIRGKGNFISERNPGASMPGLEVTQHPVRCTLSGSIDETEMEFRIEPPTESISQNLKRKTAVVVIADRWYKSAGKACAYSLSFIPIEVISGKQIDLREKEDLFQYLEHGVYEDAVSSTCQLSYTTTGNFTAVKYMLSQHASFILVQETLYDENSRVLVSSKHYIPVESFKTQVNAVAGRA